MLQPPSFITLLYKRDRIVEDYGVGNFAIPDEDEVVVPEEPGRRVTPRQTHIHEDLPVIPMDERLPMDPYNVWS